MGGAVDFQPVFIVGDHRSGTTVLYQALARTGAFNVVTAYHVINNAEFVANFESGRENEARRQLAARFAELGLTDRGIDGVMVTPDLPEEYGFIIDPGSRPHLSAATAPALIDLCQRIRRTGGDAPILLKNPWDVLCFDFIRQVFPGAKLIFVHRHPLSVMNSQLAATRSLFAARNEYVALLSSWYRELFDHPFRLRMTRLMSGRLGPGVVGRHVVKATRYYLEHIDRLPRTEYVEIRYEDLCERPAPTLGRILDFLGLRSDSSSAAAEIVRPRTPSVLPEVLGKYRSIRPALANYCARHKYDLEGPR